MQIQVEVRTVAAKSGRLRRPAGTVTVAQADDDHGDTAMAAPGDESTWLCYLLSFMHQVCQLSAWSSTEFKFT